MQFLNGWIDFLDSILPDSSNIERPLDTGDGPQSKGNVTTDQVKKKIANRTKNTSSRRPARKHAKNNARLEDGIF